MGMACKNRPWTVSHSRLPSGGLRLNADAQTKLLNVGFVRKRHFA